MVFDRPTLGKIDDDDEEENICSLSGRSLVSMVQKMLM